MTLTPNQRKERLGHGGLADVARELGFTLGHVSEVNRELRADSRVTDEITRRIVERHPDLPIGSIWPMPGGAQDNTAAPRAMAG